MAFIGCRLLFDRFIVFVGFIGFIEFIECPALPAFAFCRAPFFSFSPFSFELSALSF
jgi:hypothetical protein